MKDTRGARRLLDQSCRVADVALDEPHAAGLERPCEVLGARASVEDDDFAGTLRDEAVDDVRADEPGPARDQKLVAADLHADRKRILAACAGSAGPSDDSLIKMMREKLAADSHHFGSLVETIVSSPQFLTKRGTGDLAKNDIHE